MFMSLACGYGLNRLYASAMGSMVFIIPSDVIKSSGIINPVDPLASEYNLFLTIKNNVFTFVGTNCNNACSKYSSYNNIIIMMRIL